MLEKYLYIKYVRIIILILINLGTLEQSKISKVKRKLNTKHKTEKLYTHSCIHMYMMYSCTPDT